MHEKSFITLGPGSASIFIQYRSGRSPVGSTLSTICVDDQKKKTDLDQPVQVYKVKLLSASHDYHKHQLTRILVRNKSPMR